MFTTNRYVPISSKMVSIASPLIFCEGSSSSCTNSFPTSTMAATTTGIAATFEAGPLTKVKAARSQSAARRLRLMGAPPKQPLKEKFLCTKAARAPRPRGGSEASTSPGSSNEPFAGLVASSDGGAFSFFGTRDSAPNTKHQPAEVIASAGSVRSGIRYRPATQQSEMIGMTTSDIRACFARMLHTNTITSTATTEPMRNPSSNELSAPPRPKGRAYKYTDACATNRPTSSSEVFASTQLPSSVSPAAMPAAIAWQPVIPNWRFKTMSMAPKNNNGKASKTRKPPSFLSVKTNQPVVKQTPMSAPQPNVAGPINTTPPVMKASLKTPTSRPLSLSFRDGIGHMKTSNNVQMPRMSAHHFMPKPYNPK
mmetsp:Transcript_25148/g.70602  ORF Transcript_25148/g.70602 Transcript_25148/m.70602 type:complete len:367 (+) Transcript_25148:1555-2655(+)